MGVAPPRMDLNTRVLVTQAGTRNGYVITHTLGAMGIPVYGADVAALVHTRFSRYCRGYSTYPSPHTDPEAYVDAINRIVRQHDVGLVIPAYDEALFLSGRRAQVDRAEAIVLPPYADLMTIHRKVDLYRLAERVGARAPVTIALDSRDDLARCLQTLKLPLVIKPERGGGGWGVVIVRTAKELEQTWRGFDQAKHNNRLFAQQMIFGEAIGCGAVFDRGRRVAIDTYGILRQHPVGVGTATYRTEVRCDDAARQVHSILAALSWTGVAQFDFIVSEEDGNAYLIDGNPRFWGSVAHAVASGANVPFLYYLIATGQSEFATEVTTNPGVSSIWLWGDLFVLFRRLTQEGRTKGIVSEHVRSWKNVSFDDFHRDDICPFLFYPVQKIFVRPAPGF